MKQFLKPTKEKIYIALSFLALSFIVSFVNAAILSFIIRSDVQEEVSSFTIYLFQVIPNILFVVEIYLYACIAVYLIGKLRGRIEK